ncbi:hypothetical protein FACS189467_8260 [Bacteroidia bacterium]|nr:hypothetical protein FACS189467_8260 [Bacteroidia bacterium]
MKKEVSKLLLNVAQLVIGGVILNSISGNVIAPHQLLIAGSIATTGLITAGLLLLWLDNKGNNKK